MFALGIAPECPALALDAAADACGMPVNDAVRIPEGAESLVAM